MGLVAANSSQFCLNCYRLGHSQQLLKSSQWLNIRQKSGWSYGPAALFPLPHRQGSIEIGKLARLANGSAVVKAGETSVLATVVRGSAPSEESFLPLTVDYKQKASAAGRIPTNFLRRDLAQSQNEILISRKIDRCLRPMFPEDFTYDTQISCNLLVYDRQNHPDVLAINAASAALALSDIPWKHPVGAVRVGWVDNKPVLNPSRELMSRSQLDLIVAARSNKSIVMLEGSASEFCPSHFPEALQFAVDEASLIPGVIDSMVAKLKPNKLPPLSAADISVAENWFLENYENFLAQIFKNGRHDKYSRDNSLQAVQHHAVTAASSEKLLAHLTSQQVTTAFGNVSKKVMRDLILDSNIRPDGRGLTKVRQIDCSVDIHPPLHGSSLFQRGQTQVMATVTLDSIESMAKSDPVTDILVGRSEKNFMLHYQFPQYATGDLERKGGGANRREIGHGALAERGLKPVVPDNFPFTMRVSAEVLESNGSSSMATVCAGSMAMLDAGVPLKRPAAGVAMGLVTRIVQGDIEKYSILTDILGLEDYAGDVDFKIAATDEGITAIQADMKIPGIPLKIILEIQRDSQRALNYILKEMNQCISQPRGDRKENWPCAESVSVALNQRSKVIGVSGMNIKRIQALTGVQITIKDDLSFGLFAPNTSSLTEAKTMIEELIEKQNPIQFEFGNTYSGKIVELQKNGVQVLLHPQMDPVFVRNSQLDLKVIKHSEAAGLPLGTTVYIKYFGADPVTGEDRWSRRALLSAGGFSKSHLPREDRQEGQEYYTHPSG